MKAKYIKKPKSVGDSAIDPAILATNFDDSDDENDDDGGIVGGNGDINTTDLDVSSTIIHNEIGSIQIQRPNQDGSLSSSFASASLTSSSSSSSSGIGLPTSSTSSTSSSSFSKKTPYSSSEEAYQTKLKGFELCLEIATHTLNGNFCPFGILEVYNDLSLVHLIQDMIELFLQIDMADIFVIPDFLLALSSFFEICFKQHITIITSLPTKSFNTIILYLCQVLNTFHDLADNNIFQEIIEFSADSLLYLFSYTQNLSMDETPRQGDIEFAIAAGISPNDMSVVHAKSHEIHQLKTQMSHCQDIFGDIFTTTLQHVLYEASYLPPSLAKILLPLVHVYPATWDTFLNTLLNQLSMYTVRVDPSKRDVLHKLQGGGGDTTTDLTPKMINTPNTATSNTTTRFDSSMDLDNIDGEDITMDSFNPNGSGYASTSGPNSSYSNSINNISRDELLEGILSSAKSIVAAATKLFIPSKSHLQYNQYAQGANVHYALTTEETASISIKVFTAFSEAIHLFTSIYQLEPRDSTL